MVNEGSSREGVGDDIRLAIVGLGDFGRNHLRVCLETAGMTVVAVADTNRETARQVAMDHGVAQWFTDPFELLESVQLDGIVIVTPASSHLPLTREAVDRGIAVLVEKPIVAGSSDSAEMLTLSDRGIVVPGHILRFASPYLELFEKSRGVEGARIAGLTARRHRNFDHIARFPTTDIVLMTMIHDIDQAIWLTGSEGRVVSARSYSVRGGVNPDLTLATVEDADGRIWDLGASWLLSSGEIPDRLELYSNVGVDVVSPGEGFDLDDALREQARHFADCIRHRRRSERITVAEAVHGIAIADAIISSARRGGTPVTILL